jgi:hypothetical protein
MRMLGLCACVRVAHTFACIPAFVLFDHYHGFVGPGEYWDVIDCAWAARCKEMPHASDSERAEGFYANFSQAVQRRPWGPLCTVTFGNRWDSSVPGLSAWFGFR